MTSDEPSSEYTMRSNRAGFTLIELMVTMLVIGLMFGLVFLRLDHMVPTERIKGSARELASELDLARNHAIVSGKTIKFQYDVDEGCYRWFYPYVFEDDNKTIKGPGETDIIDWKYLNEGVRIRDVILAQKEINSSGIVTVTFEPRGIASDHVVHLEIEDHPDVVMSVVINPLLGFIDVKVGDFETEQLDKSAF